MLLSDFKKISIDGVEMKQLFINDTQVWKSGYKNWVKYSTESDGKTIYNGGLGYKTGYRVRSGGAEGENSNAICTGFIPYKKGDLLRIIPQFTGVNSQNTINFYDSGFANLGQYNDNGSFYGICTGGGWNVATEQDGITTVDVTGANGAADIAYIRITHIYVAPGLTSSHTAYVQDPETDFIVTVNEEIPEPAYTNLLPLAINADGTPYVGTNGEKGYKTGYRINSSRAEVQAAGRCCTGFIPVKYNDKVRVKNIYKPTDGNINGYVHFYGSDPSTGLPSTTNTGMVYEGNASNSSYLFTGDVVEFVPAEVASLVGGTNAKGSTAYMRISTGIINKNSIVTVNEEITD